uniref:Allatostatin C n=1 Tax=Carabus violaceus TaxID=41075 RepID=A0A7U3MC76_CARVO|nr:allatostatin C [Carabus violaceus]
MQSRAVQIICCSMLVLSLVSVCTARPPQGFSESSPQATSDLDSVNHNMIDGPDELTALKMQLLAQQLSEYNALQQLPNFPDRFMMSKRQQRYRQCYFNPISCFRK